MKNTADMDPIPPGMPSFQDYGNGFHNPNISSADNNGASSSSAPPPITVVHDDEQLVPPVTVKKYSFNFPPGFRFVPEDRELVCFYLPMKIEGKPIPTDKVQDANIYKHNPDVLTEKYKEFGVDDKWYFYTSRDKKYKNGSRPNRETEDKVGFWKATGKDKEIMDYAGRLIAKKKSLAYIKGKAIDNKNASSKVKTEWLMHEYVLEEKPKDTPRNHRGKDVMSMELDTVLCKIYKKDPKGKGKKYEMITEEEEHGVTDHSMQQNEEQSDALYSENQISQQGQSDLVELSSMLQQQQQNYIIQQGQDDVVQYSSMQQQQQQREENGNHMIQQGQDLVQYSSLQQQQPEGINNMIQQGRDLVDYSSMQQQEEEDHIVKQEQIHKNDRLISLQNQLLHQLHMQQQQLRRSNFQQNHQNQLYMQQLQEYDPLHPSFWQKLEDETDQLLCNQYYFNNVWHLQQQQQQQQAPGIINQNVAGLSNACLSNATGINSFSNTNLGHVYGPTPFNYYDHFLSNSTSGNEFFGDAPPEVSNTVHCDQAMMGGGNYFSRTAAPGVSNAIQSDQLVMGDKRKRGDKSITDPSEAAVGDQQKKPKRETG